MISRKFRKLRNTSFDELRGRFTQAAHAVAERHSLSKKARLVSDRELELLFLPGAVQSHDFRQHLLERRTPNFFPSFKDPATTVSELRRRWPATEQSLIEQAEQILTGRFNLLGFQKLYFGDPINWHLEPIARKQTPLKHWSLLNYLDADLAGDKKIIWELNRHQHFITLGQAYWFSNDERFAIAFDAQVSGWMEQNPPKRGINWASNLEVAFRSISWLWALNFFARSASLRAETVNNLLKFLYLSALHLETYLSTYFSPNTHLTGEALGLFYIGSTLPEFKEAERWRRRGLEILLSQLPKHVQADGVYFEQSSYYHRYTTDFYLHLLILLRENKEPVPVEVQQKLSLLLDHLMYITRPDGTTPLFGDDDGGRLVRLDEQPANDFRSTLATGAAVLGRGDYKFVARGPWPETLWLLGPEGLENLDRTVSEKPGAESVPFKQGGYYAMRDGWEHDSNYLLFDCGPHGAANCGHAHADALSFELVANGRTLLVDPGTYTYTGSQRLRDWFRSSAAHNTVTLDDQSSSVSEGPFSWLTKAKAENTGWIAHERFDYVSARHDGFQRLASPAQHYRSILFLKHDYWIVRDRIVSFGPHDMRLWFHFDSGVAPLMSKSGVQVVSENGSSTRLQITTFGGQGSWGKEEGWVSHCYGEKEEAPVFTYSVLVKNSEELVTFLLPEVGGAHVKPVVREIEAINGRAIEVNAEGSHDLILMQSPEHGVNRFPSDSWDLPSSDVIETARVTSDFDLSWVRFANEASRTPDELVLIGGHIFELEGRQILQSVRRVNYFVATRVGDQYRIETDAGVLDLSSLAVGDLDTLFAKAGRGSKEG